MFADSTQQQRVPDATRRANAAKSKIRSRVEHVFAAQKDRMQLFVRTIGIARATVKIAMTIHL
jgi:IS5 family transposase